MKIIIGDYKIYPKKDDPTYITIADYASSKYITVPREHLHAFGMIFLSLDKEEFINTEEGEEGEVIVSVQDMSKPKEIKLKSGQTFLKGA